MSYEPKGSTPGPITTERNQLTKVNTFPSVEFTIPPSDPPEQIITKCASRHTQNSIAQAQSEKDERNHGDGKESYSVAPNGNEVSYPEGGLRAWLVVLGSFMASVMGFGMM
jgi:hypothetical protein